MISEWKENTGVVPEGVTAETAIEVQYADGEVLLWSVWGKVKNDDPDLWEIKGDRLDVIRWRFVDDQ